MIQIKNIIFIKSNLNIFEFLSQLINHLLPLRLKCKNESFVLLENKEQQGLITLDKDSKSSTRFKITKLILENNSTFVAQELTQYVITRYRAMGANAFYIVVDENDVQLLNIFRNELNFRQCGCEYLYKVNIKNSDLNIFLKPIKKELIKNICDFYNENINSFNRFLFARAKYQFKNDCNKYVFLDEKDDKILGYFEVATKNNFDFYINFSIDLAYNVYLIDAIKFINSRLKQKYKKYNLYIKIKDYFTNSKDLLAILKENDMEFISKGQILAKDYYKQIKDKGILENAKIIFTDPTTA